MTLPRASFFNSSHVKGPLVHPKATSYLNIREDFIDVRRGVFVLIEDFDRKNLVRVHETPREGSHCVSPMTVWDTVTKDCNDGEGWRICPHRKVVSSNL